MDSERGKPLWGWRHYLLGNNSIAGVFQMLVAILAFTLVGGGFFAFLMQN